MFTKNERSTFKYWFAHWCAFQMTALNLKAWKPKYLFHDIEKPFLKVFLPYTKVQKLHRKYHRHHLEYWRGFDKIDIDAMLIDWECSRFTKDACPMDARETWLNEKNNAYVNGNMSLYKFLMENVSVRLRSLIETNEKIFNNFYKQKYGE